MPKFRLTLCYNVRHYSEVVIEAKDKESAKAEAEAEAKAYWIAPETDYEWNEAEGSGEDIADALEPCIWVEEVDEDGELIEPDEDFTVVNDPSYAYREALLAFASKIARLTTFLETVPADENPEAAQISLDYLESNHQALEALITEARKLTGIK